VEKYGIDASRLYAMGYSNGANIAAAMMLLHPGVIAGGVLLRPMVVIRPEPLPDLQSAPLLISAGEHDEIVTPAGAEELGRMLSKAGAHVDIAMQNAGHDLTPADFNLGKQWFARLLAE
jgi:phospholipase/carboxylesterase